MIKKIILIIILYFLNNCSIDKVVKHHGVHFLDQKQKMLKISESNTNDVKKILGPPSTENVFEDDLWIYIERKTTVSDIKTLGKKKLLANNVLVLEFNNRGILIKKDFYDKNSMNKIEITESETIGISKKQSFISSTLQSLKRKINDPLGTKTAR
jgi:outer membrane protein assembly factor BamE (lipoprotein component of BamABCDE complex)